MQSDLVFDAFCGLVFNRLHNIFGIKSLFYIFDLILKVIELYMKAFKSCESVKRSLKLKQT